MLCRMHLFDFIWFRDKTKEARVGLLRNQSLSLSLRKNFLLFWHQRIYKDTNCLHRHGVPVKKITLYDTSTYPLYICQSVSWSVTLSNVQFVGVSGPQQSVRRCHMFSKSTNSVHTLIFPIYIFKSVFFKSECFKRVFSLYASSSFAILFGSHR